MIFKRFQPTRNAVSKTVMALALVGGFALTASAIEAPAHAQNNDKAEAKANYSKGFVEAFSPVQEIQKSETPDYAAIKAAIPAFVAAIETPDDRLVAGNTIYLAGDKTGDRALQLRGVEMMLESGKVAPDKIASYNQTAFQLANVVDDFDAQRKYLKIMADANQSFEANMADGSKQVLGPDQLRLQLAETYFRQNRNDEGFEYLKGLIAQRVAAGQEFPQSWITRPFTVAYEGENSARTLEFSKLNVEHFPSATAWADAIAVTLNDGNYESQESLDLLRLARRLGAFNNPQLYLEYVEVADPRRYPGEVVAVIDQGWESGVLPRDNSYAVDARAQAAGRLDADRADLPGIASEARASGAGMASVVAAGDVYLSYDKPAEAEEFYTKALTMPGVNTPLVLTRLGIAQFDQGKYAEAQATFDKVTGARQPIASLWSAYAAQKAG